MFLLTGWLLIGSSAAMACPDFLEHWESAVNLCELYDQYHQTRVSLNAQLGPKNEDQALRLREVIALRFIQPRAFYAEKAKTLNYDPLQIYEPAPTTWVNWEKGANRVARLAGESLALRATGAKGPMPISEAFILSMNEGVLDKLAYNNHHYRDHREIGSLIHCGEAQPQGLVDQLKYPLDDLGNVVPGLSEQLTRWHSTRCYEEMSAPQKMDYDERLKKNDKGKKLTYEYMDELGKDPGQAFSGTWRGTNALMECGFIEYSDHDHIRANMQKLITTINQEIANFYDKGAKRKDPFLIAARVQRWFIGIHPFTDGNGRVSRFLMDYVLMSLGLPPPILENMDHDIDLTEEQWAAEIAKGVQKTVKTMQKCLTEIKAGDKDPLCQLTPALP